ncbi:hypothetical protein H5J25_00170 [Sphingomonas aliaeris]|uniref:Uncharacterized protein n=1 Tax=Sphingomonas aliaeris TaxID=2759526 RepID=A0A974S4D6_9SPHN|nr:hypothetical protein [Sphingomonas aliaeris]QQV77304.1 hypothetical protein H5J25_00170 [Sphingomonas aliaeris]
MAGFAKLGWHAGEILDRSTVNPWPDVYVPADGRVTGWPIPLALPFASFALVLCACVLSRLELGRGFRLHAAQLATLSRLLDAARADVLADEARSRLVEGAGTHGARSSRPSLQ